MRGKLTIIAISSVLLLGNMGFNFTPVYGGGGCAIVVFDGDTDQDWNTPANWNPDAVPLDCDTIEIGTLSPGPPFFDVNIGDGTSPGVLVTIGDGGFNCDGTLDINDGSTLTVKEFSTLVHDPGSCATITVPFGATLTIDGTLTNNVGTPSNIVVGGLLVISSTGILNNFGGISGTGDLEVCGTLIDTGTITVNQVACSGTLAGSVSIAGVCEVDLASGTLSFIAGDPISNGAGVGTGEISEVMTNTLGNLISQVGVYGTDWTDGGALTVMLGSNTRVDDVPNADISTKAALSTNSGSPTALANIAPQDSITSYWDVAIVMDSGALGYSGATVQTITVDFSCV